MRLLFKQRFFSWFDSYDIYDEDGSAVYTVKGQLSWGHCLHILDAYGNHIGTVQEKVFTFLPKFELYDASGYIGCISNEFTLFRPQYTIDCRGWTVEGSFLEWDYSVYDGQRQVAQISKELLHWTDTYVLDIADPADALYVLMLARETAESGRSKGRGADPSGGSPGRPLTCGLITWKRTALGAERRSFFRGSRSGSGA